MKDINLEVKHFKRARNIKDIVLIAHNLSFAKNVAALFQLAHSAGVNFVYLGGQTPRPPFKHKALKLLSKSREEVIPWKEYELLSALITQLKGEGYYTIGEGYTTASRILEKDLDFDENSVKIALVIGNENQGLATDEMKMLDLLLAVPVYRKNSNLPVVLKSAILLYYLNLL